jgi:PIN like domain
MNAIVGASPAVHQQIARRWLDRIQAPAYKLTDTEGGRGGSRGLFFLSMLMRKSFPGYYRPSDAEFRKLWDSCLFVLDANVLLNLYRYSDETRKKLLDIMQQIRSRLWVPHQAALEYQRNRLEVISAQKEAYKQIGLLLEDTSKKLETQLRTYKRHPLISAERLHSSINEVFIKQLDALKKVREKHPDFLNNDPVR